MFPFCFEFPALGLVVCSPVAQFGVVALTLALQTQSLSFPSWLGHVGGILWVEGRQRVFVHMKVEESWWWTTGLWLVGRNAKMLHQIEKGQFEAPQNEDELQALRYLVAEAVVEVLPDR